MSGSAAGSAHETALEEEAQRVRNEAELRERQEKDAEFAAQEAERMAEAARIQADIDAAEQIAFEAETEANRLEQEQMAQKQPPVDNDHVAPGATLFTAEETALNKPEEQRNAE